VWVVKTFKDKALVYSILFKSAVYAAILVCMDILEEVMVGIFHGKPAAQGMTEVGGGGMKGIVLVGIMAFVLLIPLFAFREISDAIGQEELQSLLLKKTRTLRLRETRNEGSRRRKSLSSLPCCAGCSAGVSRRCRFSLDLDSAGYGMNLTSATA
jgi:hypothetical protein